MTLRSSVLLLACATGLAWIAPVQQTCAEAPISELSAASNSHTCARRDDGALWCWGFNVVGQLGDGTSMARSLPVQVATLGANVVEVVDGKLHTCARKADGTLWCWGFGAVGQLGDGASENRSTPVQVSLGGAVIDASARRGDFTCAVRADGTAWCWGSNSYGQLGDGTTNSQTTPTQITALGAGVAEIATGGRHSCARKVNGTVFCWGDNSGFQLGDGTSTSHLTPVQVTQLGASVTTITCGDGHSCALKNDGTLWCWGFNFDGELGDGTNTTRSTPVQVNALGAAVSEASAGYGHTCARKADGSVWCWGWNVDGQVGDGTTTSRSTPQQVLGLSGSFVEVSTGDSHTCTRRIDRTLWCWGLNHNGQLGDGTATSRTAPVQVASFPPVASSAVPVGGPWTASLLALLLTIAAFQSCQRSARSSLLVQRRHTRSTTNTAAAHRAQSKPLRLPLEATRSEDKGARECKPGARSCST